MVPIIIGALGTVPAERFIIKCLEEMLTCRLESFQRARRACWLQTESFAKSWTSYVTGGDLMFKEDTPAIHSEAVFNEDNNS